ncbi:hypothetical protein BDY21DRAFT_408566 [Lineolata rhizophorae]|uniref:Uncharacterized protein n=1 Tax=Lineolata rhizophorae TaxID=578093 RepID=A0A6A6P667_9PEZI|nr:hypothetical protein BDY21DRAFT_408566 [Lineolata rhizophorae]
MDWLTLFRRLIYFTERLIARLHLEGPQKAPKLLRKRQDHNTTQYYDYLSNPEIPLSNPAVPFSYGAPPQQQQQDPRGHLLENPQRQQEQQWLHRQHQSQRQQDEQRHHANSNSGGAPRKILFAAAALFLRPPAGVAYAVVPPGYVIPLGDTPSTTRRAGSKGLSSSQYGGSARRRRDLEEARRDLVR